MDEDQELHDAVGDEGQDAGADELHAIETVHDGRVALVLEDPAARHHAHARDEESLGPPVDVHARDVAARDVAQDLPVVEAVDVEVGARHAREELRRVAAREVEDEDAEDDVQDEVGVAAHVERDAVDVLLGGLRQLCVYIYRERER